MAEEEKKRAAVKVEEPPPPPSPVAADKEDKVDDLFEGLFEPPQEKVRKFDSNYNLILSKQELMDEIAKTVNLYLSHFYRHNHFDSKESYKFLSKKLTQKVYRKRVDMKKMYLSENTKKDIRRMIEGIFKPRNGARYVFTMHKFKDTDIH